jgi:hypothetical protein
MDSPADWQQFVDRCFYGVVTGGIAFLVISLQRLCNSVNRLNKNIAVIIRAISDHDHRIKRIENTLDGRHR